MALGASQRQVFRLVVGEGLGLTVLGVGIGLVLAAMLTPLVANQLFGIAAWDPFTYATIPLVLVLVALAASAVPARRAARVDPMTVLRNDV